MAFYTSEGSRIKGFPNNYAPIAPASNGLVDYDSESETGENAEGVFSYNYG
jgi:hypothetical protein